MSKTDITVIIPIYNVELRRFRKAVKSIETQKVKPSKVMLVVSNEDDFKIVGDELNDEKYKLEYQILMNDTGSSFQSQMNFGVSKCTTDWFSYLEQDDELSDIWFKNVYEYMEHYDDVDMFLPLVLDVEENEKGVSEVLGLTNEAVWALEFSENLGVLDNPSLLKHQNFNFDGMVMRKEAFEDFGGLKNNIRLTFMYEFLLRMTNEAVKVMVIPKIGYKHLNMRKGGLFETLKDELTPDESRWWLATAKREFYHHEDRELTYKKL